MITAKVGIDTNCITTKYSQSHSRFLTMSARTSALLTVIMYAPIIALAVSFGATGYQLLTQDQPHGVTIDSNSWD